MGDRIRAGVIHRLALLVAGGMVAATAAAAPGDYDTDFNRQGIVPGTVITDFGSASDQANAVALQPDGKIVAAGTTVNSSSQNVFALARYNNDGSLDADFNFSGATPGTLTTAFEGAAQANALVVQPDGKIVAAGTAKVTVNGTARNVFALVRYQMDGTLDPCFNPDTSVCSNRSKGGTATTATAFPGDAQGNALALQADGKLVVAGTAVDAGNNRIALARFNPDGSLDKLGFNAGGAAPGTLIETNLAGDTQATAMVIQRDGKILVAGYRTLNASVDFVLLRYNADGTLDTAFNAGGAQQGIIIKDLGGDDRAYALLTQFDDKIVVAGRTKQGTANGNFFLARYDAAGSPDTNFGQGGIVITAFGADADARALAQQPDGMLLAVGFAKPSGISAMALARYTDSGVLDGTFKNGGALVSSATSGSDAAYALALDPKAKIVVAGETDNGGSRNDFLLARYSAATAAGAWQLSPDPFALDNVSDVKRGTFQTSTTGQIQGLGTGMTVPVLVSGGTVSKDSQNNYMDGSWAQNNNQFTVGHTADAEGGSSTTTTLSIGGLAAPNNMGLAVGPVVSATFTSTTARPPQITASHFSTMQSTEATTYYSFVPRATEQGSQVTTAPCGSSPGALVFSINKKPSWARFDKACGKLDGFPGGGDLGTTTGIVISVKDQQTGLTASLPAFDLKVTNSSDGGGLGPLSLAVMLLLGAWRRRAVRR